MFSSVGVWNINLATVIFMELVELYQTTLHSTGTYWSLMHICRCGILTKRIYLAVTTVIFKELVKELYPTPSTEQRKEV